MPALSKTFDDLRREIGFAADYGASVSDWSGNPVKAQIIEDVMVSGLTQFYWYDPPELQKHHGAVQRDNQHAWSFLKPLATLDVLANQATYELPEDFAGLVTKEITLADGTVIGQVNDDELQTVKVKFNKTGTPQYFLVRPKAHHGDFEGRMELVLYPTPDTSGEATYRYEIIPNFISTTNKYPHGSRLHSVTILESCLAALELKLNDAPAAHSEKFHRCLLSSIELDLRLHGKEETSVRSTLWLLDSRTNLKLNRKELRQRMGHHAFKKPTPETWNESEKALVQSSLVDALRRFYYPIIAGRDTVHQWSFLYPTHSFTTTSGVGEYDLPADFANMHRPITYAPGTTSLLDPIEYVSERQVMMERSRYTSTGQPRIYTYRVKRGQDGISGTGHELVFFPVPSGDLEMNLTYRVDPEWLINDGEIPEGGVAHSKVLLHAALASIDELIEGRDPSYHSQRYMEHLQASIKFDQQLATPATLGFDFDGSDIRGSLYGNHGRTMNDDAVKYNGAIL